MYLITLWVKRHKAVPKMCRSLCINYIVSLMQAWRVPLNTFGKELRSAGRSWMGPRGSIKRGHSKWYRLNILSKSCLHAIMAGRLSCLLSQRCKFPTLVNVCSIEDSNSPGTKVSQQDHLNTDHLTVYVVAWLSLQDTNQSLKWKTPPRVGRSKLFQEIVDMYSHMDIQSQCDMRI